MFSHVLCPSTALAGLPPIHPGEGQELHVLGVITAGVNNAKGYRGIVVFRKGDKAFFVYGFPKSELGNIRDDEAEQFKKAAKSILALSDDLIRQLIENDQLEEVMKDG